jgi:hypothetical protein
VKSWPCHARAFIPIPLRGFRGLCVRGFFEEVDAEDQRPSTFSRNSACAAHSSVSLPPTFTDSSPPWLRPLMRHTLPQALSRVRSISPPGSVVTILDAPHVNLIAVRRYHKRAFFDRVLTILHAPHVTASPVKS